jgi:hypothetical protein
MKWLPHDLGTWGFILSNCHPNLDVSRRSNDKYDYAAFAELAGDVDPCFS